MKTFSFLSILLVAVNGASFKFNPLFGLNERIVGGELVDIKDHPHQVSLQTDWGHFCGGSIISRDWVLTAAHCVYGDDPGDFKVRIGSSYKEGGEKVDVSLIVVHNYYSPLTIDYDFALVKLSKSLEFSENVQSVKLTEQDVSPSAGNFVTVSGWGSTQTGESTDLLRAVEVPIVDQEQCNKDYFGVNVVTPRMICAGLREGGKDSCQGDSGGPMTADNVLVGVVSWGLGCAMANYPGVYARVSSVRDWIKQNSGV